MNAKMIWFLPYWMKVIRLVLLSWVLFTASCQSFRLCCQYNSSCQMKIFIPDIGYQQSFVIYYILDTGTQENVIRCEWSHKENNYTCNSNDGFICEILEKSISINIRTDLQPGNFSLQIPRNEANCNCPWDPKESCRHISNPETFSSGSSTAPTVRTPQEAAGLDRPINVTVTNGSVHNPPPAEENSLIRIAGSVVGVVLLIAIVTIIYFYKKPGRPCHKKPNNHDSSEDCKEPQLNIVLDESEEDDNSAKMLSVELVSATSQNSSTGNSSSYYERNYELLRSRGGDIVEKDNSSSSQTNITNRGYARNHRPKNEMLVHAWNRFHQKGYTKTNV